MQQVREAGAIAVPATTGSGQTAQCVENPGTTAPVSNSPAPSCGVCGHSREQHSLYPGVENWCRADVGARKERCLCMWFRPRRQLVEEPDMEEFRDDVREGIGDQHR